jgi:hypothetical protein
MVQTVTPKPILKNLVLTATMIRVRRAIPGWFHAGSVVVLLLGLLASAGSLRAAPPAQTAPVTLSARAGFDGYYKDQRWLPIRVLVGNDGPDLQGSLEVSMQRAGSSSTVVVSRQVDLSTQSRREFFLYVPTEGFLSNIKVSLISSQREIASQTMRVQQAGASDILYGLLAGSRSAYNVLADVEPLSGSAYVAELEAADLPPLSYAWQALDVLVVSDVDTGVLLPEVRAAMASWVAAGGRLIVAGGPTWQKTAAGVGALLPLAPAGTTNIPDTDALAAFTQVTATLGTAVVATGALSPDATVLLRAGDLPLIVTRRVGFGQVIYLAFDPAFDPLANWSGLEAMFRNVLSGTAQRPSWAGGLRNWYSAREAVDALPGLNLPSALQVCGFLGLYILFVGPLNYVVLRRLKRRELAWVTVPALVVVFSLGAYLTGYQLRGGQATLHRLAIVQVWPDSEFARVDGLVGLFSPRRAQYDLGFGEGFLARPMPNDPFGGGAQGGSFFVQQADVTVIPAVRMEIAAVEPFVVQGLTAAPEFESQLSLEVGSSGLLLKGNVVNRSGLSLADAVLLAPGGIQRLGEMLPGASVAINLPLSDARAASAPPNDVLPAQAALGAQLPQAYAPPSAYDPTIDDILGNTYYYNDREQFRRYSLLSAVVDSYGNVRGNGVYLVGWNDGTPLTAEVINGRFQNVDQTLYLINFQPQLKLGAGTLVIPPGLMTWISLGSSTAATPTPYDMYLLPNIAIGLQFTPAVLPYEKVLGLTLHLASYGATGPSDIDIDIWDFTESTWVRQPPPNWGDTDLATPERFVGPRGEIRVQAFDPTANQISVERIDFSLVVGQ